MANTPGGKVQQAQRIAVANNAAVVLSFVAVFKDADGKEGYSPNSANLTYSQSATIDMAGLAHIGDGAKMRPRISVVAVSEPLEGLEVEFAPNGLAATYTVTGNAISGCKIELI
jgi:hypothetical protein